MKNKYFKTICSIVGLAILIIACSKDISTSSIDDPTLELESKEEASINASNFLTIGYIEAENKHITKSSDRGYDPHIETIIDDLFAKDAQNPFIDALVDAYGYPSWQYAVVPDQMGGALGITGLMKTTDNFVSAVMTSAIREDGSVEYGLYSREDILSVDYDLPLSNLISVTQNVILTNTIFNEVDCELSNKLLEEIEGQIEEGGLKSINISGSRDCLEVEVFWQECTDYYSVAADGTKTFLYTSCNTWTETYYTGCDSGYPGANPVGGWDIPPGDEIGPVIDPDDDGQNNNTNSDTNGNNNNNNENEPDNRTLFDVLCDKYSVDCDCILSAEGTADGRLILKLINENDHFVDPCNQSENLMENILSSVCNKNGDLTSSALLEEINATLNDPLIGTYNDMAESISNTCGDLSDLNNIVNNMNDCNFESFTSEYQDYFNMLDDQNTNPTLSVNNRICPNNIELTPHASNPTLMTVGLQNFNVSFNSGVPGNPPMNVSFGNLYIEMANLENNCPIGEASIISQAMNNAVTIIQNQIITQGYTNLNQFPATDQPSPFYVQMVREMTLLMQPCSPANSPTLYSQPILTNNPSSYTNQCGTVWRNVLASDFTVCN